MAQEQRFYVNVDAHGNATTDYDRVGFTVSVQEQAAKSSLVKEKLKQRAETFNKFLTKIRQSELVKLEEATVSTTSSIGKNIVYDRKKEDNVDKGFIGMFHASFETSSPDEASAIYEELLELDGFVVQAPEFRLKHQEKLKQEALRDAFARLQERFKTECEVMGENPDDFEILTWNVNYQNNQRAMAKSYSVAGSTRGVAATLEGAGGFGEDGLIQASKALVTIYLTVSYARKEKKQSNVSVVNVAVKGDK